MDVSLYWVTFIARQAVASHRGGNRETHRWIGSGKQKQKSVETGVFINGNTKRRAEVERIRIPGEWTDKILEDVDEELFCEYMKRWLGMIKHTIAETTYHSYKNTNDIIKNSQRKEPYKNQLYKTLSGTPGGIRIHDL